MSFERQIGILLPIFSLPGKYGIGSVGESAYNFVDFLKEAEVDIWQILPLSPTGFGNSPYQSSSAFAGNEYYIDLNTLCRQGLLKKSECDSVDFGNDPKRIDYSKLFQNRLKLLKKAFLRFDCNPEFSEFAKDEEIFEYALFSALKEYHSFSSWLDWEEDYRNHDRKALNEFYDRHKESVDFYVFLQYLFFGQYKKLKDYATSKGIKIFGDMPLYVSLDSVDVWSNRELFLLDSSGNPTSVAGVPPDAFSSDGQLWGNPLYDWDKIKEDNYSWWNKRIKRAFDLYDILRIDHFRGFERFYSIPNGKDAKCGEWVDGPKFDFFKDKLQLDIVAEDLGIIDDGVRKLLSMTKYPGMKILLFAFNDDELNPYLPSNFDKNSVVYTGTHDNLPVRAYIESLNDGQRKAFIDKLKTECKKCRVSMRATTPKSLTDKVVELAAASKAERAIIPMWDLLRLGEEGRINFPSTLTELNWSYRYKKSDFTMDLKKRLLNLVKKYNR